MWASIWSAVAGVTAGELRLPGGREVSRIVIPAQADATTRLAARELAQWLERRLHKQFPMLPYENGPMAAGSIYVGMFPEPETIPTGKDVADAFVLQCTPDYIAVAGLRPGAPGAVTGLRNPWALPEVYNAEYDVGAFGEAGSLYGVYYFLEQYAGIRFYWPGESGTVVPEEDGNIDLPEMAIRRAPQFSYRYAWLADFSEAPEEALWFRRIGFGGAAPVQIIDYFQSFQRYRDSNPEYFALADGVRDFNNRCASRGGGHLCLSNPMVVRRYADDAIQYFDQHPEAEFYPVVPNDGLSRICECPDCQAELDTEAPESGRFSNHIWGFVNRVAVLVAEKHPSRYVGCLAYEHYLEPPSAIERLHPNVAVMVCRNRGSFAVTEEERRAQRQLDTWLAKSSRVYGWDYYLYSWLPWRNLPVVFPAQIQRDLAWLSARGYQGEFIEAEAWFGAEPHRMNYPGMQHLNLYVTGKLYWDPNLDLEALLREYFLLAYGPGGAAMEAFFHRAEALRTEALKQYGSALTPSELFTVPVMEELNGYLRDAERQTPPESSFRRRVAVVAGEFTAGCQTLNRTLRSALPEWEIPTIAEVPHLDGIADERIYREIPGEFLVTPTGEGAAVPTYLYLAQDRDNLYFLFLNYESELERQGAAAEAEPWEKDCVELYLAPDAAKPMECFQFIVTADGELWDAVRGRGARAVDPEWDSGFLATVRIEAGRWVVEGVIPLAQLGPGREWRGNFFRNRPEKGQMRMTGWSPTLEFGNFVPQRFGRLLLTPKPL